MFSIATLADVPELNKLVNTAYRGDDSRRGWTTEADLLDGTRIDEDILRGLIQDPKTAILVYKESGTLMGCVELRIEDDQLYLGMLSVWPELQAKGIGSQLMVAAESYASERGLSAVVMTVISERLELIAWYERKGYIRTGESKTFSFPDERWGIPRQPLEFVVLKKDLTDK